MTSPKISVVIPVYNAETYIERCANTLFSQTLDNIEYIFINDKTPDKSFEILNEVIKKYPHRKNQIKIIEMPKNSKQAGVRTVGMQAATGLYTIHCDPDDWLELNAYEILFNKASETHADIITCNFYRHVNKTVVCRPSPVFKGNPRECLKNLNFNWALYSKLIKTNLIKENNIYPFKDINCSEDLNTVIRALYYAKSIDGVENALYHYNQENPYSITKDDVKKNIALYKIKNIELLTEFFKSNHLEDSEIILNRIKFAEKIPLLTQSKWPKYSNIKYFCSIWTECHDNRRTKIILDKPFLCYLYSWYLKMKRLKLLFPQ